MSNVAPERPITHSQNGQSLIARLLAQHRFEPLLIAAFAALALALASPGIFGSRMPPRYRAARRNAAGDRHRT